MPFGCFTIGLVTSLYLRRSSRWGRKEAVIATSAVTSPPAAPKSQRTEPHRKACLVAPGGSHVSRAIGALVVLANLSAFGLCAWLAFARNIHALFYHYDGSYMFVDARNQLAASRPIFTFTNDFLQSIGNIQFTQNARLLFFFWPIGWFSDPATGKIAAYLVVAAIVFLSTYGLARLLSQPRWLALAAGWIVGFVTTPFVPMPFFYPILEVAPGFVVIVAAPVIFFALTRAAGRSSALADVLIGAGIIAFAAYLLAASLPSVPLLAPVAAIYIVMVLLLSRSRLELLRKLAVLAAALCVMLALRWPWYVLGLFDDTAPYLFPTDFSTVYNNATYVSVLFHGSQFGVAGPALVAFAATGALLSLRNADALRVAAWTLLASLAIFMIMGFALSSSPHWILPPPIYLEVALWPLYGVFAAVTLRRLGDFLAQRFASAKPIAAFPPAAWLVPATLLAVVLVLGRAPTDSGYPFPPSDTPAVEFLKSKIALRPGARFSGRVATISPVKEEAGDLWNQQFVSGYERARAAGNDEMSLGLWYYRIPTLFEYNQFTSPEYHALIKRTLQRPAIPHQRNISIISHPDVRILKLLGVRFVLMPRPAAPIGEVRATEDRAGQVWDLIELSDPNLATYAPTEIETRRDLASTFDVVVDENVDLSRKAVAQEDIAGALTSLRSSSLSTAGEDLHIVAESAGRSLVVVPVEFSHCMGLHATRPGTGGEGPLLRIDGVLTGIVFEHVLDAVLSFRAGPLRNPLCRWRDYQDIKAMLR